MRSSRAPLPRWKRATGSTGRPRAVARAQEIPGRGAQQRLAAAARGLRRAATSPACRGRRARRGPPADSACEFSALRSRSSQRAKSGTGDSVTKVVSLRILARNLLDHLLDQEVAERDAGKPALAVGDRIEHRRRRPCPASSASRCSRRIGPIASGNLARQRDLDEDQRLVDQRRMEEGVAAPVRRIDAAAQIVPARGSRAPPRSG